LRLDETALTKLLGIGGYDRRQKPSCIGGAAQQMQAEAGRLLRVMADYAFG
jgi:hypothetical protein